MFLLWKNILWIPIAFLVSIGEPFKWDNDGSNLKNISEKSLKAKYNEAKGQHYVMRIAMSAAFIIGCMIFLLCVWVSDGFILIIFPVVTLVVLLIDAFMAFARYVNFREKEKEAEARNEIVVMDYWKDTSLNSLMRKRKEERQKYYDMYLEKTGKAPVGFELDRFIDRDGHIY